MNAEALIFGAALLALRHSQPTGNADEEGGEEYIVPSSERIERAVELLAEAIAHAEGYGVDGAIPTVRNNPGDLGDVVGGKLVIRTYPSAEAGWDALRSQARRMLTGIGSRIYSPDMTFEEAGRRYEGTAKYMDWVRNVCAHLGTTPDTTLSEWLESV